MHAILWHSKINLSVLDDEVRRTILLRAKNKLGFTRTPEVLGIAVLSL